MIAHSAGGFTNEAAIPVVGMQSVPDLDLPRHFRMMVKAAVTNKNVFASRHDGKLRRNIRVVPAHYFLDEINRPLAFGVNA